MRLGALAFFLLAATGSSFFAKKPITVEDMLSYHFSPGPTPVWSPDGNSFTYEEDGSVYLYRTSTRKAKLWFQLSSLESAAKAPAAGHYPWRDRHAIERKLQWFPNGRDLLVSAKGDLFIVHPGGRFDNLTNTEAAEDDPKLSPDGKSVLYRTGHNLFVLDLATRKARQLTDHGTATLLNGELDWVYPEELDLHTATWWSPDSKRIAYLQFDVSEEFEYPQTDLLSTRAVFEPERYPQAGTPNANVRLGTIPAQGGSTVWANAGGSPDVLIARVAWLPDSSRVALETMPRLQNRLDLMFCSPADGACAPILHDESKTWVNIADNLVFLKSKAEFLWTSERSGFRHLYRYAQAGQLLAQLTSGDWQVDGISAVDERSGHVYYTGSEESPLETHLYEIALQGGDSTRLTPPGFNHDIQANDGGSWFLDNFSSLSKPPESVLRNRTGQQVSVVRTNSDPAADCDLQAPQIVKLTAPGNVQLYAKLIKPAGFQAGKKYPAIVHVYGGPGFQTVRNTWSGIDWLQVLASRGYVVWELDNRGSIGRGHAFEAPIFRELGKQEVADQRFGVEYLVKLGFVDPARIGITGWSYGGYMTIHSMLLAPDLFKVGVAGAPVTDWHNYDTIYTERYMGLPDENEDGYDASSNVENADELQGRLMIVHNFEDDNVLFQNTMQFANAAEQAGKPYWLQIYGEKTHHVSGKAQRAMYDSMLEFLDRNLK